MTAFHPSITLLIIVGVIAVIAVLAILGWRAPDRSPGADTQAERQRIED
jgi:uncharacterized membrane protein